MNKSSKNIKIALFFWVIFGSALNIAKSDDIRLPDSDSMRFGKGYDSITGEIKPTVCVSGKPKALNDGNSQKGELEYEQTNSLEKLSAFTQSSVAASYGNGAFSADAFYSTMSEKKYSRFNEHLIIKAVIENQRKVLPEDKLKPESLTSAAKSAWKKGPEKFRDLCGDMFVGGEITGGEFIALFSGETSSTEEQNNMSASLKAAGKGSWGEASGGVTVEQRVNKYSDQGKIQVKILRKGPKEEFPQLSVNNLIEYARTFPNRITGNVATFSNNSYEPWTLAWIATDYKALGLVPNDLAFMLDSRHEAEFGEFDHAKAQAELNAINEKISGLKTSVMTCVNAKIKKISDNDVCNKYLNETVAEIPDRKQELLLNPKVDGLTEIVTTPKGVSGVLDIKGRWWLDALKGFEGHNCSPYMCTDGVPRNYVPITNLENGRHINVVLHNRIRLPQNSAVYFVTHDNERGDNNTPPEDHLRAVFYRPLYPEDFKFPDEINDSSWGSKPM
jgi:hypothetical protein